MSAPAQDASSDPEAMRSGQWPSGQKTLTRDLVNFSASDGPLRGPAGPYVAITFDDGPWPGSTSLILQQAQRLSVPLTFFVVGREARHQTNLMRQIRAQGHEIANHTEDHLSVTHSPKQACDQINQTEQAITATGAPSSRFFRPPGGRRDSGMAACAHAMGLHVVNWNVSAEDWKPTATTSQIVRDTLKQTKPGSVILLHDGGGKRAATIAAFPLIVERLRAQGYTVVPLATLLGIETSRTPAPTQVSTAPAPSVRTTPAADTAASISVTTPPPVDSTSATNPAVSAAPPASPAAADNAAPSSDPPTIPSLPVKSTP